MDDTLQPSKPLAVPQSTRVHFNRNFITQAVCELRFPTLFELEEEKPPIKLAHALRKEFPTHSRLKNLKLNDEKLTQTSAHSFRSRKDRWIFNLRTSAITLETSHYDSFEDFKTRLSFVLNASLETIDSDFFTRVGLRYINGIPCTKNEVGEWINPDIVAPLSAGIYGEPVEFSQRVYGNTDIGGKFLFQHGLGEAKHGSFQYILDYDFSIDDVLANQVIDTVQQLHDAQHNMFRWSLGKKALEYLERKSG